MTSEIQTGQGDALHSPSRDFLQRLARHANGLKPAADVYLRMGLSTEVSRRWTIGGFQIPLDDRKPLIRALDHKPVDRVIAGNPADLALKFLQARHEFSPKATRDRRPV